MRKILLAVAFTAAGAFAQGRPSDVSGWDAVRWGMGEVQAVKALDGRAKSLDDIPLSARTYPQSGRSANYGVRQLQVEHLFFDALLVIDRNGFIDRVLIQPVPTSTPGAIHFQVLERNLIAKYGQPDYHSTVEITTTRRWIFPTTIIELTLIKSGPFVSVSLYYQANGSKNPL